MTVLILSLSAAFALAYGARWVSRPPSAARAIVKTAPVLLLALWAGLGGGGWLLAAGLALAALGDLFLAYEEDGAFLAGMGAFFGAHAVYVVVFLAHGTEALSGPRAALALGVALWAVLVCRHLWPGLGAFRLPVLVYSGAIGAMGIAALGLPFAGPGSAALYGALLFILSDSLLAAAKFRPDGPAGSWRWAPRAVWALYWLAQVLIAGAFVAA